MVRSTGKGSAMLRGYYTTWKVLQRTINVRQRMRKDGLSSLRASIKNERKERVGAVP